MAEARAVSWRLIALLAGIAIVVWTLDFVTKEWVLAALPEGRAVPVLGELLQWRFVRNPGAAFSLASGMTWIFTIIASGVAIFIVVTARRIRSLRWALVLGALLGGVVGNLTDRLTREPGGLQGHVIDFIQVWGFPAIFNLADVFVVSAMLGFVLLVLRGVGLDGVRHTDEPAAEAGAEAEVQPSDEPAAVTADGDDAVVDAERDATDDDARSRGRDGRED